MLVVAMGQPLPDLLAAYSFRYLAGLYIYLP
jgi:hypothetical protein